MKKAVKRGWFRRNERGQLGVGYAVGLAVLLGLTAAGAGLMSQSTGNTLNQGLHESGGKVVVNSQSGSSSSQSSTTSGSGTVTSVVNVTKTELGATTTSNGETYQTVNTYLETVSNSYSEPGNTLVGSTVLSKELTGTRQALISTTTTTTTTPTVTNTVNVVTTQTETQGHYSNTYSVSQPTSQQVQETVKNTVVTTYDPLTGKQTAQTVTDSQVLSSTVVSSTPVGSPTSTLVSSTPLAWTQVTGPTATGTYRLESDNSTVDESYTTTSTPMLGNSPDPNGTPTTTTTWQAVGTATQVQTGQSTAMNGTTEVVTTDYNLVYNGQVLGTTSSTQDVAGQYVSVPETVDGPYQTTEQVAHQNCTTSYTSSQICSTTYTPSTTCTGGVRICNVTMGCYTTVKTCTTTQTPHTTCTTVETPHTSCTTSYTTQTVTVSGPHTVYVQQWEPLS